MTCPNPPKDAIWARFFFGIVVVALGAACGTQAQQSPLKPPTPWEMQHSTTKAGLRGIHAVGGGVAWASGTNGTVLRTEDGGYMWQSCAMPPGTDNVAAEKLDFRGIWAWDADTAVAMSSGPGELSRLYKTTDGCSSWKLLYANPDKDGFWDAVQFWDRDHGLILGDPARYDSASSRPIFVLEQTNDGGKTWHRRSRKDRGILPEAGEKGSGAFAASNSSVNIQFPMAWFGVGGQSGSFVYVGRQATGDDQRVEGTFENFGFAWAVPVAVPLASGNDSSGVFSLAFRDRDHGMAVGGDYKKPNESAGTAAYTSDGGKTWKAAAKPPHGYRSAVAWDAASKAWIAVGTNGTDLSYDDGKTWRYLDSGNWNALSLPWAVGPEGRIAKLVSLKPAELTLR